VLKRFTWGVAFALSLCVFTSAEAAPIILSSPASFSGSQTILTFQGVSGFFSTYNGVTFDLVGTAVDPFAAPDSTPGRTGPSETTSIYTCQAHVNGFCSDIEISLNTTVNRFGFDGLSNLLDNWTFTLYSGNAVVGTTTLISLGLSSYNFYGVESALGFDRVLVEIGDVVNSASFIDNVMFEATAATPVPEPALIVLFGSGLAGVVARARRRRPPTR
jgi:hypothetical protein